MDDSGRPVTFTYRPEIDGLRAIAVILVILFHLDIQAFSGGFVGVDIFFVISGFLITTMILKEINEKNKIDLTAFYKRRFWRLFPSLAVTVAISSAIAIGVFSHTDLKRFGSSLIASLTSASNFLFWAESNYFDISSRTKPLLHTWSLSLEQQFYLIWPALLLVIAKSNRKKFAPAFLLTLAISSFFFNINYSSILDVGITNLLPDKFARWLSEEDATIFFLLPFRIYEFCIGALLAYTAAHKPRRGFTSDILTGTGVAFIAFSILLYDKNIAPYYYGLVSCLGAALIIQSSKSKVFGCLLNNPLSLKIGVISYSLYLVHWPIVVFWEYITLEKISGQSLALYFFICFLFGQALYNFIEKPFRTSRHEVKKARTKKAFSIVLTTSFLMASGVSMWLDNGWAWRIDIPNQLIEASKEGGDFRNYYGGSTMVERPSYNGGASPTTPGTIFIGDSYNRAYHSALLELYPDQKFTFFEYSGCEFFSLNYYGSSGSESRDRVCHDEREAAFEAIRETENASVVVSQHWYASYLEDQTHNPSGNLVSSESLFTNTQEFSQFIIDELKNLKESLGIDKITIIGGPPKLGLGEQQWLSIERCIFLPWGLNNLECSTTQRSNQVVSFHDNLNSEINTLLANTSENIKFINPFSALCTQEACRNFDDEGMPIYSDYGHFSTWGNRFVIEALKEEFDEIFVNHES